MGNWNINIQGTGPHHNHRRSGDANNLAAAFIARLIQEGHTIQHASFTHGGAETLLTTPEQRYKASQCPLPRDARTSNEGSPSDED